MAEKGKELNPATCTFVKKCNPGQVRNMQGRCVSEKKSKMVKKTNGMLSDTVPEYAPLKKSKSKRKKQIVKKLVIDNSEKNVIPHYEYNSNNEELVTTNNNPLNKQKTKTIYRNRKRGKDKGTFGTTNKNGKAKSPVRNSLNLLNYRLGLTEPRPKRERKTKETVMDNNSGLMFNVDKELEVRTKVGNRLRQNTQRKYSKTQAQKFLGQGTGF